MAADQDPIADVLKAVPTSDRVRAAAWDAFHDATDKDDLAARLKDLPIPDDVKAALWDAKPEMTFATVNDVTLDTSSEGPVERFAAGAVRANPVTNAVDLITQLVTDPTAAGKAILDPSVERLDRASTAHQEGRPLDALGNLAAAVPMIGPYVGGAVDRAQAGDVAGALGELSWMGLPLAKKGGAAALAGAKRIPGAGAVLNPLADLADRWSTDQLVDATAPKVGANKARFGRTAARIAPELAREPGLSALSREGFHAKVEQGLQTAAADLDAITDAIPAGTRYGTDPLLGRLMAVRDRLMVSGSHESIIPEPRRAAVGILNRAIGQLQNMGPSATFNQLRKLRQAWDEGAKAIYTPSVAQDALKLQSTGRAYADAASAVRDFLTQREPSTAAANARYSLFKSAADYLRAAEEAERVRPKVGRRLLARAAGAMEGGREGGVGGAAVGAMIGGIVERAAEAAPTHQILLARKLATAADAVRVGNPARAQQIVTRLAATLPKTKAMLRVTGKAAAMLGRSSQLPATLAAEKREQAQRQ